MGCTATALGKIGDVSAIKPLIKVLTTDKESGVREDAANALAEIGDLSAIEPLIKALTTDKDSGVREDAVNALAEIGDLSAIEPLKNALKSEEDSIFIGMKDNAFDSLEKISKRLGVRITNN